MGYDWERAAETRRDELLGARGPCGAWDSEEEVETPLPPVLGPHWPPDRAAWDAAILQAYPDRDLASEDRCPF